jgi:hypothetical protein
MFTLCNLHNSFLHTNLGQAIDEQTQMLKPVMHLNDNDDVTGKDVIIFFLRITLGHIQVY